MEIQTTQSARYEPLARIGKALSSPHRLAILDLLAQAEKNVEALATSLNIDMRLASAHLRQLREAGLVESRRQGRQIHYRLADTTIEPLISSLRATAEQHLAGLAERAAELRDARELDVNDADTLLRRAARGEVLVIDVRPADEYATAHLPGARSIPLAELRQQLEQLPPDLEIVAYCRGPFCVMSDEAVALLRQQGLRASKLRDGVSEWRAAGLPLESAA